MDYVPDNFLRGSWLKKLDIMYMKRKVLIRRLKKHKNLNFHKNGLRPL